MSAAVPCARCGEAHDLTEIEPTYRRPDPLLAIPPEERADRAMVDRDWCVIRSADHVQHRYFLRVLLPVPVHGRGVPCSWGVWVEVELKGFDRVRARWDDPLQADEPPIPARLANVLLGYEDTVGLPGLLRLTGPTSIPSFHLLADVAHPLAEDQRSDVDERRALAWAEMHVHS